MLKYSAIVIMILGSIGCGYAQQQSHQQQSQEDVDLKVDALPLAIGQRNAALDSLLACQASSGRQLDKLHQEVAELKRKLSETQNQSPK